MSGDAEQETAGLEGHVIIAGFGRVGQTVATILQHQKVPFVALDLDAQRIEACRQEGLPVFYGDARRADMFAKVGAEHAVAVVFTLDDPVAASWAILNFRQRWPDVRIYARARDSAASDHLTEIGADHVFPETIESSLQLSGQLLAGLGFPGSTVDGLIDQVRRQEYSPVQLVIDASENDVSPSGSNDQA